MNTSCSNKYKIPAHRMPQGMEIFGQIGRAEMLCLPVRYETRAAARRIMREIDAVIVPVPAPPPGLPAKDQKKVERLARRAVKALGIRRRVRDYPVPDWVKRSVKRTEYYRARILFEIEVRKGYKNDIA